MNNFEKLLLEIKNNLHEEECVKQYLYYKSIVDSNDEIKKLDEEARFHQKQMCKNKDNNEIYTAEKSKYEEIKNKLDNNPILINYQIAKDEVYSLLVEIKELLS